MTKMLCKPNLCLLGTTALVKVSESVLVSVDLSLAVILPRATFFQLFVNFFSLHFKFSYFVSNN